MTIEIKITVDEHGTYWVGQRLTQYGSKTYEGARAKAQEMFIELGGADNAEIIDRVEGTK